MSAIELEMIAGKQNTREADNAPHTKLISVVMVNLFKNQYISVHPTKQGYQEA